MAVSLWHYQMLHNYLLAMTAVFKSGVVNQIDDPLYGVSLMLYNNLLVLTAVYKSGGVKQIDNPLMACH